MQYRLNIPSDLDFSSLSLEVLDETGEIAFNSAALESLCAASGLSFESLDADPRECKDVIAAWYTMHRAAGGAPDAAGDAVLQAVEQR